MIGVSHREGCYGVEYMHYLLETLHVPSVPLPHLGGVVEPSVFLATRSFVQVDEQSLLSKISRTIPGEWACHIYCIHLYGIYFSIVSVSRMLLKRKVWMLLQYSTTTC